MHPRLTRSEAARKILALCVVSEDGCWVPRKQPKTHGYVYVMSSGVIHRAHRLIYETLVGPIPDGLQIDHLCRNRPCINPLHLEPVTARQNSLRGQTFAARRAAQTHCLRGHAFDLLNTYISAVGTRKCRECMRGYKRRHRQESQKHPMKLTNPWTDPTAECNWLVSFIGPARGNAIDESPFGYCPHPLAGS